jgi:hypothetical protein
VFRVLSILRPDWKTWKLGFFGRNHHKRDHLRVRKNQLGSFWSLITNQSNNTRENGKVPFVVDRWQLDLIRQFWSLITNQPNNTRENAIYIYIYKVPIAKYFFLFRELHYSHTQYIYICGWRNGICQWDRPGHDFMTAKTGSYLSTANRRDASYSSLWTEDQGHPAVQGFCIPDFRIRTLGCDVTLQSSSSFSSSSALFLLRSNFWNYESVK